MPHRGTPPPVVTRRAVIGVMGSGREPHSHLSAPLGTWLGTTGCHLLTGGGRGVMELVSKTFSEVEGREGSIIGVVPALPGSQHEDNIVPPAGYPNPYTEIVIRTQCPLSMHPMTGTELSSRNHINILSSDIVIALPGSSGTWSEIQLAIRYRKPLILFLGEEGGEIELALDEELQEDIRIAKSLDDVKEFVHAALERRQQILRAHAASFVAQQEAALRRETSQSSTLASSPTNSGSGSGSNGAAGAEAGVAAAAAEFGAASTSTSNGVSGGGGGGGGESSSSSSSTGEPAKLPAAASGASANGSGYGNGEVDANPANGDSSLDASSSSAVAATAAAVTVAANGNPSSS